MEILDNKTLSRDLSEKFGGTIIGGKEYGAPTKEFGSEFFREIKKKSHEYYQNSPVLEGVEKSKRGNVKGSNQYFLVLSEEILQEHGMRNISFEDLMKMKEQDIFPEEEAVNLGLVLRSVEEPNKHLAKILAEDCKEKGYEFSEEDPLFMYPSDLYLENSRNTENGLAFRLRENSNPVNVPEFDSYYDGLYFEELYLQQTNRFPRLSVSGHQRSNILHNAPGGLRGVYSKYNIIETGFDILDGSTNKSYLVAVKDLKTI